MKKYIQNLIETSLNEALEKVNKILNKESLIIHSHCTAREYFVSKIKNERKNSLYEDKDKFYKDLLKLIEEKEIKKINLYLSSDIFWFEEELIKKDFIGLEDLESFLLNVAGKEIEIKEDLKDEKIIVTLNFYFETSDIDMEELFIGLVRKELKEEIKFYQIAQECKYKIINLF